MVDELTPGKSQQLQSLLRRPPLGQATKIFSPSDQLASKLAGLVSLEGKDVMLQATSEVPVKHQRVRCTWILMALEASVGLDLKRRC